MGVEIDIAYQGKLRCQATHRPSGAVLLTDAPKDNGGKGEAFSPTDLAATALGTCLITVMALVAERDGIDISGMHGVVVKEMVSGAERRIGKLTVRLALPPGRKLAPQAKQKLLAAAKACPVHRSLHPDVTVDIEIALG